MKRHSKYSAATSLILATLLTACGGGSGGGQPPVADVPPAAPITLSGTAATGAPFGGADIGIFDKTNTKVGSGKSNPDGSYEITLSAGATPPFVLQAVRDDLTLVSIAAGSGSSTINITPITNLIASRLSVSGDPNKLAAELQANPALLNSVTVDAKVAEIVALLKPLLDAVGATANPLTGKFAADGTGSDRALDSLLITITPSSATTANIEVAVKQQTSESGQPVSLQFTSAGALPATLPAIDVTNLVSSGTTPLIADLLQRMTACFALPVADRVNTPVTDLTNGTATASEIKADACKTIFANNNPASYKGSGKLVGYGQQTSFNGIFTSGGNGVKFDRGSYEHGRDNPEKDFVIGYRQISVNGDVLYDTLVVRPDNAANPTKLGLIGNQYKYPGGVTAYHQLRSFTQSVASGVDYYSSGYAFSIPNAGTGADTVQKVVVTSPKGNSMTLLNGVLAGSTSMGFTRDGTTPINNAFLRLVAKNVDTTNSSTPPATDPSQFFADPILADSDIASYPAQISWKFEYYAGTTLGAATLTATQYFKTRARPQTIAELRTQELANLTPTVIQEIKAAQTPQGVALSGEVVDLAWDVPAAALMPTTIKAWGYFTDKSTPFKESSNVLSSARSGIIYCKYSASNCNTGNGKFKSGTMLQSIDLWARDPSGREYSHFYALYQASPG